MTYFIACHVSPFASLAIRFFAFITETLKENVALCERKSNAFNAVQTVKYDAFHDVIFFFHGEHQQISFKGEIYKIKLSFDPQTNHWELLM